MSEPVDLFAPAPAVNAPRKRGHHGPTNAAGFGGWFGLFWPAAAAIVWLAARAVLSGGPPPAGMLGGMTFAAAVASLVLGYVPGWVGMAVARWLRRARLADWPDRRTDFLGGFAAGSLTAGVFVWLLVVWNS